MSSNSSYSSDGEESNDLSNADDEDLEEEELDEEDLDDLYELSEVDLDLSAAVKRNDTAGVQRALRNCDIENCQLAEILS